jgi:thiol-disulfide isomerase/thioredoxin
VSRYRLAALVLVAMSAGLPSSGAADPFWGADPAWNLIHEPAVEQEMKLSPAKSREFRRLLDEVDAKVFPLRNKSPDQASKGVTETLADLTNRLESLLSESQFRRLAEMQTRQQGTDLTRLGRARFKAPELVDSGEWLNSEKPVTLASLAGKVVVLHFYAFGCINCIRNYPTYLDWQERFRGKDVMIIGIHTPETAAEQDSRSAKAKAIEAGFTFPVLIDNTKANWEAWGNSMWPSLYLIDKRGYLRHFWPGELKWQGATGDVWMRERIDDLLSEPAPP